MQELTTWWQEVGGTFFGQPWIRWVAFIILLLSVMWFWTWAVKKVFG